MKKLVMPALGAALALGGASLASADPIQLAQIPVPGQPGWTGTNRTVPPGTIANNTFSGGVVSGLPSGVTSAPTPRVNAPELGETADLTPGEVDSQGRITPTNERRRARFVGERGPDGKILPTYVPQRAQATPPPPQTDERMRTGPSSQRLDAPSIREQTRDADRGQSSSGTMGPTDRAVEQPMQGQRDRSMQAQQREKQMDRQRSGEMSRQGTGTSSSTTAMLNTLSAQGYRPTSNFQRSGNDWMGTAVKDGREVTVVYDPRTHQVSER